MTTSLRKAIRDLRADPWRSGGIVAALVLGLVGFVAVLSSYAILTRALNDGYRESKPPSATLRVEGLGDADLRALADSPDLEAVEPRRTIRGRIKVGAAQWRNLVLFVRPEIERSQIAQLALERGAWPSGAGEIAIERDALQVARADVGDIVVIRTEEGAELEVAVRGSVHDVGQAQARMENLVYAYVHPEALPPLGESPGYDAVVLRVATRPDDEAHVQAVAERVAAVLAENGVRTTQIDVHPLGEHPHAKIMGLLLMSIAVFGLFILALSGVLVFNLLTAVMARQMRQIGVMKALGALPFQIARIYLLEAAVLGIVAVAIALPLGLLGARVLSRKMAVFLNFDIASFAAPAWLFVLVLAVGMLVPLLAAFVPVWRGSRVPVRDALAAETTGKRAFGTSVIDRWLARASSRRRLVLLAVRNAARNRLRTGLTIATLAIAGIFFMSALDVRRSLVATVDRFYASSRADLSVSFSAEHPIAELERRAAEVPGVALAEAWSYEEAVLDPSAPAGARNRLWIFGVPRGSQMMRFDLAAGDDDLSRGAVVNSALWDRLGRPAVGTTIELPRGGERRGVVLSGVTREPFAPPFAYVTSDGTTTANALRIALRETDASAVETARVALEGALEGAGLGIDQATTKVESRYSFDAHMEMIYVFLIIVSVILGAVGALGVFTTASLNVMERRRELGILRALGATPARIAILVLVESVAIGFIAWLVATLAVVPLTTVVGDLVLTFVLRSGAEITTAAEPAGVVLWLGLSLLASALATVSPARDAARVTVREALAHE